MRWRANAVDIREDDAFNITIINDSQEEETEYFELVIKVKKNGFLNGDSTTVVRVTIFDDDTCKSLNIAGWLEPESVKN